MGLQTFLGLLAILEIPVVEAATKTIFVATEGAGVYRSVDGGDTWMSLTAVLPFTSVNSLATHPLERNTVYAGGSFGIYRSVNGGDSWAPINQGLVLGFARITDIVIDQTDPDVLYASAGSYDGGVFKSVNGGSSWTAMNTGLTTLGSLDIRSLIIDPDPWSSETLYLTGVTGLGSFKTVDGGQNWTPMLAPGGGFALAKGAHRMFFEEGLYASGPFASSSNLVISWNDGTDWEQGNDGVTDFFGNDIAVDRRLTRSCPANDSIFDPECPRSLRTLYLGASSGEGRGGVFKSTDGGQSWTPMSQGITGDQDVYAVAIDPLDSSVLLAGSEAGVFRSTNGGANWSQVLETSRAIRAQAIAFGPPKAANLGVFRGGSWLLDSNHDGVADKQPQFGWDGVTRFAGDWDGDGDDEIGIFANGYWYFDYDGDGAWDGPSIDRQAHFGWAGVTPLVGDWNGDGRDKLGIFINGFWYFDYDGDGAWDGPSIDRQAHFGWAGVTPLVGDWNGDGRDKLGIFINGFWYVDYDGDGVWGGPVFDREKHWGWAGVTPLVADWNGDGRDKIGVYIEGQWLIDCNGDWLFFRNSSCEDLWRWRSSLHYREALLQLERWSDLAPVVGDWNGDGRDKIGGYFNGSWVLDYDGDNFWDGGIKDKAYFVGQAGSTPVVGRW